MAQDSPREFVEEFIAAVLAFTAAASKALEEAGCPTDRTNQQYYFRKHLGSLIHRLATLRQPPRRTLYETLPELEAALEECLDKLRCVDS